MTREDLLKKLYNIMFCTELTVLTSECCLEVKILTSDGVNYSWMGYDEWFVYELREIVVSKWNNILEKLSIRTLLSKDVEGTDLERILLQEDEKKCIDCNSFFETLKAFPFALPERFYCTYSSGEKPTFYINEEELALELKNMYSDSVNCWDDMEDAELEYWYDVYENCAGIPCYCFEELVK